MEWIRKASRLTLGEALCLSQAWLLFLFVDMGLRLVSFQSLLRFLHHLPASRCPLPLQRSASSPRLARLVEIAGRLSPIDATCLKQALVLRWLLARRGQPSLLRIGVARDRGDLRAHAWIEQEGRVLLGYAGESQYTSLFP